MSRTFYLVTLGVALLLLCAPVFGQAQTAERNAQPADQPSPRPDQNSMTAHEQLLEKARSGRIEVYFEGDSITRRWGTSDEQYKQFLTNWRENFFGWNAADFGWGGDTTQNILWRLNNGELDNVNPKVVVVLAGTNNVGNKPPKGSEDPRVNQITRGIKAIVDICRQKAPNATIVLMGITPRNDNMLVMPIINQINDQIAKFAEGKKIRYLNINDKLADKDGKLFEGMANKDSLHLDVKGYQVWANALKPIFRELLGPPSKEDHAPPPTGDPRQSPRDASSPQKEIAITIDDLPLNGQRIELERLRAMTGKLLGAIKRHQIPVLGFVNESLLYTPGETDARIAILKAWVDAGVELGNHTFSHVGFRDTPITQYEDDFIRGESVTKMLMKAKGQKLRYFRHPFLQMGPTLELEKSFESFIAERGYRIAPVTVDTMDWMILVAYSKARAAGDAEMMKRVADEYLKFAGEKLDFCEKVANELFGHPIKHILLLHANELNADNFDALVQVIKDRGYQFITLGEALDDPVYQFPDRFKDTSDWLSHWAYSKGQTFASPAPPEFIQKIYSDSQKPQ